MAGHPAPKTVYTKQARIAELAKQMPGTALRTLSTRMDAAWMYEAFRRTRKDGAAGVDGVTAKEYAKDLGENLSSLLDRAKSGDRYRAPPVRRVHIPKGKGKTRPIGIPTFEDKILQRSVVMLLEPLYERDFYDFSYGFRPRRSPHDALDALNKSIHKMGGGWVLDVDIRDYFGSIDRTKLQELVSHRVADGVIGRLIGKWLRAGVQEEGVVDHPDSGTPQGGVISPILSNIYLHEVIDKWWVTMVVPRLYGQGFMVRYADDFVMVFSDRKDALRVQASLPKRLRRFGLEIHPEKTRLLEFRRPRGDGAGEKPGSFDFLGFTHYWCRSRRGYQILKRKTAKDRFSRGLHSIRDWASRARHVPIAKQVVTLASKLRGHFNYYGIQGNSQSIINFHYEVLRIWKKWLGRRSQRGYVTWEKFNKILWRYPLPPPRLRRRGKAVQAREAVI